MSRYLPLLSGIAIGVLLAVACHTDYKKRIIPNAIPILILAAGFFTSGSFLMKFVNLAAMVLIIVVAEKTLHQHSGGGDIKLYLALSFALGLLSLGIVLMETILIYAIYHVLTKKGKLKGRRFPVACFVFPSYCIYFLTSTILL